MYIVLILNVFDILTSCGSENFDLTILLIGSAGVVLTQHGHGKIVVSRVRGGVQNKIHNTVRVKF